MRRAVLVVAIAACGQASPSSSPPPQQAKLDEGVVARVESDRITGATVARVAATEHVDVSTARDRVVQDAIFAAEARARRLDEEPDVRARVTSALARALVHDLRDAAVRAGPVTDKELDEATQRRWLELARPEGFQTMHAVVRFEPSDADDKKKRAAEIADAIRAVAVALPERQGQPALGPQDPTRDPAKDALFEPFKKAATDVPHEAFQVVVEALPFVTASGAILAPDGATFDEDFAKAASKLERRGDVSGVVVSRFGAHVIVLLDRLPARMLSADERRRLLTDEILSERARAAEQELLAKLRPSQLVDRNVDANLELVRVGR